MPLPMWLWWLLMLICLTCSGSHNSKELFELCSWFAADQKALDVIEMRPPIEGFGFGFGAGVGLFLRFLHNWTSYLARDFHQGISNPLRSFVYITYTVLSRVERTPTSSRINWIVRLTIAHSWVNLAGRLIANLLRWRTGRAPSFATNGSQCRQIQCLTTPIILCLLSPRIAVRAPWSLSRSHTKVFPYLPCNKHGHCDHDRVTTESNYWYVSMSKTPYKMELCLPFISFPILCYLPTRFNENSHSFYCIWWFSWKIKVKSSWFLFLKLPLCLLPLTVEHL